MHPLAFALAVAAALTFALAALGHEYPRLRLVPLGLCLGVVAWIVQRTVETANPVMF